MLILRSLAFNVAFYINILLWMVLCLPGFLLPTRMLLRVVHMWSASNHWLLEHIAGVKMELRGAEKLPKDGCIIASKHQSAWETVSVFNLFPFPAFILKRELMWIPMFGWYAWRLNMIPVDRGRGSAALKQMAARAAEEIVHNRQILIYPEGTRRPAGAPPEYKYGVAKLYADLGARVVPVALNSGIYWPRRTFIKYPGTIVMEFLDPIEPGLDTRAFLAELQGRIEAASDRLIEEAAAAVNPSPVAIEALAALRARQAG
ncbi:MAG: 1-acyl-sn-glycerol-3-phosphate acyltransferase [Hyphomicrobiaceae bacterium]|nr:1-acyl-sn-glycerol-3-phosphate acyltransferase [Hyphomicrobiaceae bacterium]